MASRLACVVVLLMVGACASSGKAGSATPAQEATAACRRLADDRYGPDAAVTCRPNETATYVLVVNRTQPTAGRLLDVTSYFVYAVEGARVVFEERALQGSVAWQDVRHLKVQQTPGAFPREGAADALHPSYLVDVYTGRRVPDAR